MRDLSTLRLALPLLAVGLGCDESPPPPQPAAAAAPAKKKVEEVAPVPEAAAVEYGYNPIGKRDPFRSSSLDRLNANDGAKLDEVVCAEPLCQFDLDDLKVVAVVSGDANPLAMVEDKNKVGYVVRRNTKMGRQGGKVTQVLRDCIVVTSFITGPDGKAQPNKSNMCIQADARTAPVLDLFDGKLRQ